MANDNLIKRVNVSGSNYDIIDAVSTWTIGSLTRNLSNAGGETSSVITAADLRNELGLTNAMHFIGIAEEDLTDGSITNPITIDESSVTAVDGDVVISGSKELVWANSKWNLMGDTGDFALKTIAITGTGALSGGGTLTQDRTITHNTYTAQNSNNTSGQAQAVLNVVSDGYGHVTSVQSGTIAASFTGSAGSVTVTSASYTPAGTNEASAVNFSGGETDTVLGTGTTFTTEVTPTTTGISATATGTAVTLNTSDFVTGVTPVTSKLSTTSISGCGNNTTASHITSFSGGSVATFTQGTDSFTAATHGDDDFTPAAIQSGFFDEGSLPSYTAPTFTANTPTVIDVSKFNAGAFPTVTDSTWAFAVDNGTLSITGSNSNHSGGTLPSLESGFYTAGQAASLTGGSWDAGSLPSIDTSKFSGGSFTSGTFSGGSFTQGTDSFNGGSIATLEYDDVTVATKSQSATTVATGSLDANGEGDSVVTGVTPATAAAATSVSNVTDPTITLATGATGTGTITVATGITSATTTPGSNDTVTAITNLGTATAAAQTFTGTTATIESTGSFTPAGNISVTVTTGA